MSKGFYIKREGTVIDVVADARALADRDPVIAAKMDNIAGVRREHDDMARVSSRGRSAGFMGQGGDYLHLARIPDGLFAALLAIKPDFLQDRPALYRWLTRHPEFRAVQKAGT